MENDLWENLKTAKKPIVLYGMGNGADKVVDILQSYGITPSGIFASDGFVRQKTFRGMKMSSYSELSERYGEMTVLICFGTARKEALCNIERIAAEQELFAPDVPVFGDGLFTNKFVEDNREAFEKIYGSLADEKSRLTFKNIVNFKLSGKIFYLKDCETCYDEPYDSFLKLSDDESYIDLGAYTGDTVKEFSERAKNWREITAVEPDKKTFAKLKRNTENIQNICCINACVSDKPGIELLKQGSGRGTGISETGLPVRAVTVDEIAEGRKATFIKMDIEGEEVKAINGMKNTLLRCKPKLQIACYHRTEDLISIPEEVFAIKSGYKLYMRHFPGIPAWDTNYYFI